MPTGWMEAVISLLLVVRSRFMMHNLGEPPGDLVPKCGVGRAACPYGSRVEFGGWAQVHLHTIFTPSTHGLHPAAGI